MGLFVQKKLQFMKKDNIELYCMLLLSLLPVIQDTVASALNWIELISQVDFYRFCCLLDGNEMCVCGNNNISASIWFTD